MLKENINLKYAENLERTVIKFLGAARDMDEISQKLVGIIRDGIIDEEEKEYMKYITRALDEIALIIEEVKQRIKI